MHVAQVLFGLFMERMTEIRIEGRGGQGNVVAAYMLAEAALEAGRFAQAFPSFGPERRGAPVSSFVRIADGPIRRRCQVEHPLYVIIQDPSLLHVAGIAAGVLPEGGILVNSAKEAGTLGLSGRAKHTASFPATSLAMQFLREPIPNTALLAAFLSLTGLLPLWALERVLVRRFSGEALQRNVRLMLEASTRVGPASWNSGGEATPAPVTDHLSLHRGNGGDAGN